MRWVTTMSEGMISLNHNDKTVMQLTAPDVSNYYQLGFSGDGVFRDVLLDPTLTLQVYFSERSCVLCFICISYTPLILFPLLRRQ